VMLGLPVDPYPDAGLPADYVGLKVPQPLVWCGPRAWRRDGIDGRGRVLW
jgi:hypothetical protein